MILSRVIALFGRAEGPFDLGIGVEQGEEDRDPFDNAGPELLVDGAPVVVEPALDGFELLPLVGVGTDQ